MKIGILGYGMVGSVHYRLLKDTFNVVVYDPALRCYDDVSHVDAIIVSVSTPEMNNGSCGISNVYDAINHAPNVPILIKSTISVEGWRHLRESFPDRDITFSPEYLRAQTAFDDLISMQALDISGDNPQFWWNIFKEVLPEGVVCRVSDPEVLIVNKYFRNSFLALKVSFANQIYDYCQAIGVDYAEVANIAGDDNRIGHSHLEVTEERGWGGHCFPKDTAAIVHSASYAGINLTLIRESIKYNNAIRKT